MRTATQEIHSGRVGASGSSPDAARERSSAPVDAWQDLAVLRDGFGQYLRPQVMSMLSAVRLDVLYDRAEGTSLSGTAADGRRIVVLDLVGGYGASLFGHNHPELVELARRELGERRPFNVQASVRGCAGLLAKRLSDIVSRSTGHEYVTTLASSGAEAVEAALKHAELEAQRRNAERLEQLRVQASQIRRRARGELHVPPAVSSRIAEYVKRPLETSMNALLAETLAAAEREFSEPPLVLAIEGAFHGKTTGALRLTHNPAFRAPWSRLGSASFVPAGDLDALFAELARHQRRYISLELDAGGELVSVERSYSRVSACFCEPIQGEGGIRATGVDYLRALRAQADELGFPLILDEIQSGFGRTGRFLASERAGVRGDYYLLAKSLGGGISKIAALLVDRARYLPDFGFLHTSTFADDEFSAVIALRALDLLERDGGQIMRICAEKGEYLLRRLRELVARYPDQLVAARGEGLMLGLELRSQAASSSRLLRVLSEQRLLGYFVAGYLLSEHQIRVAPALSSHTTVRIEPAYGIEYRDLDRFCDAIEHLVELLCQGNTSLLFRFAIDPRVEAPRAIAPRARQPSARRNTLNKAPVRRVGFLVHFSEPDDLHHLDPGLACFDTRACHGFLERLRGALAPFVLGNARVRSELGSEVELCVIAVPFTSEQAMNGLRAGDSAWTVGLVLDAVALAKDLGCEVVGCGGYTSILTDNCRKIVEDGIGVTSGNSLTVAAGAAALWNGAAQAGIRDRSVAVVGATGNIGATLTRVVAESASDILLVGRPGSASRLRRVADGLPCPVAVETDLAALRGRSLIVTASNAATPIIGLEQLSAVDPVVLCDLAVPRDVTVEVEQAANVCLIRGGLMRLPRDQELDIDGLEPTPGCVYACLAETLLLGLEGWSDHFSYGAVTVDRVRAIQAAADKHGFQVEQRLSQTSER